MPAASSGVPARKKSVQRRAAASTARTSSWMSPMVCSKRSTSRSVRSWIRVTWSWARPWASWMTSAWRRSTAGTMAWRKMRSSSWVDRSISATQARSSAWPTRPLTLAVRATTRRSASS